MSVILITKKNDTFAQKFVNIFTIKREQSIKHYILTI
jgi:hypothetical protein